LGKREKKFRALFVGTMDKGKLGEKRQSVSFVTSTVEDVAIIDKRGELWLTLAVVGPKGK
jgi:hypothetical protein